MNEDGSNASPGQNKGEEGGDDGTQEDVQNPGIEELHRPMVAGCGVILHMSCNGPQQQRLSARLSKHYEESMPCKMLH